MHLGAYAVDMGNIVGFPFLYPIDERPEFLAGGNAVFGLKVPGAFKIVVVDEEFDALGTIMASQSAGLSHIVEVAHKVLPIEGIATDIPCTALIAVRVLQGVVALTVVAIASDSLVDEVPCHDFAFAGFHHALDPLVHSSDEGIVLLFHRLGNGILLIPFNLDVLDIDIANVVRYM